MLSLITLCLHSNIPCLCLNLLCSSFSFSAPRALGFFHLLLDFSVQQVSQISLTITTPGVVMINEIFLPTFCVYFVFYSCNSNFHNVKKLEICWDPARQTHLCKAGVNCVGRTCMNPVKATTCSELEKILS